MQNRVSMWSVGNTKWMADKQLSSMPRPFLCEELRFMAEYRRDGSAACTWKFVRDLSLKLCPQYRSSADSFRYSFRVMLWDKIASVLLYFRTLYIPLVLSIKWVNSQNLIELQFWLSCFKLNNQMKSHFRIIAQILGER